jgi:23S rRNA pseudouridine2604 synthase
MMRLSKLMAERGLCSRREADELIAQGLVRVNGVVATLGLKVEADCQIEMAQKAHAKLESKVTVLLNKPVGYVSSQPENNYSAAIELITAANQIETDSRRFHLQDRRGLAPAGRLDIDSRGLLVLTQDGTIVRQIIGPDSRMEKEYVVGVTGEVNAKVLQLLRHGLELDGQPLLPARIEEMGPGRLRFVLREGKKRQIRRMCDLVGLHVKSLIRIRIGQVSLGTLPIGRWRFLGANEQF